MKALITTILILTLSAGCASRAQIEAMSPEDKILYYQRLRAFQVMGNTMQGVGQAMQRYDNSHLNNSVRMRTRCRVHGNVIRCN